MQVGQRPANMPKDDRLDISTIGKCRSDPARMRAGIRQRGRGRHSLDIGRDLKRAPTIDETVLHSHRALHVPCSTCNHCSWGSAAHAYVLNQMGSSGRPWKIIGRLYVWEMLTARQ